MKKQFISLDDVCNYYDFDSIDDSDEIPHDSLRPLAPWASAFLAAIGGWWAYESWDDYETAQRQN